MTHHPCWHGLDVRDGRDCCAAIHDLRERLRESEETLEAIRMGEIDALVVGGPTGERRVYTLEGADRPYRALIEQMEEGALTISHDGTVLYCNLRAASMLGVPQQRAIGQMLHRFIAPEDAPEFAALLGEARDAWARKELTLRTPDGTQVPAYLTLSRLRDGGEALLCGVLTDLREQKLHLRELANTNALLAGANARLTDEIAERSRVEDALRQSQKMESVGQITGGLAHDFNNLLTAIIGSLDLLQARIGRGRLAEADRFIVTAREAADRAASLAHRLLAFSRRQPLSPVLTCPNRLIAGMEDLIRRTVGPRIVVTAVPGDGLWTTLCDPNQLESALLNLAINARDAMPEGGNLTIETADVSLDGSAASELGLVPGRYASVCVSDTGTGMPPDVAERAFDPFFTTKPTGSGTGLGLSMVFGFARQSGGHVRIRSVPGKGTAVQILLPRHADMEAGGMPDCAAEAPLVQSANAAVLVVDDEPAVRMLVSTVLTDIGCTVVEAEDGPSGLRAIRSGAKIDLLVTDIGMPGGMDGRQFAIAAAEAIPGLKVLFITGYAGRRAADNSGLAGHGAHVIAKPFAMTALAAKVREMLADT